MGIKCGIVGLPNVGKSTLFNALTNAGIEAANFPFCTIEPNTGVVSIPDPRMDELAKIVSPQKEIPAAMEFVDIAGLVKGASKGEGLGNQFLANIRETHAIAHVVRCFNDENVVHVNGKVSPIDDIEVIHTELALADLESAEKSQVKLQKLARSGDKEAKVTLEILEKIIATLSDGKAIRSLELSDDDKALIKHYNFITQKPTLYIANVDESSFENNPHLDAVKAHAETEGAEVVAICSKIEAEIAELDTEDKIAFLEEIGQSEPGLNRVIRAAFNLLGLMTYFTAGPKELRAWTIKVGDKAPRAAAAIHTDFERGFICAETISYADYIEFNGESGAKDAGKARLEGKEYVVKDGDVIHFRFNV